MRSCPLCDKNYSGWYNFHILLFVLLPHSSRDLNFQNYFAIFSKFSSYLIQQSAARCPDANTFAPLQSQNLQVFNNLFLTFLTNLDHFSTRECLIFAWKKFSFPSYKSFDFLLIFIQVPRRAGGPALPPGVPPERAGAPPSVSPVSPSSSSASAEKPAAASQASPRASKRAPARSPRPRPLGG